MSHTALRKPFIAVCRSNFLFLLAFVLALSSCVKEPTILRGGVEMSIEQAAKLDYDEADQLLARKKVKEAIQKQQSIVQSYPKSAVADNALFRLGRIEAARGNPKVASKYFEQILLNYPTSDSAPIARFELARAAATMKDWQRSADLYASGDYRKLSAPARADHEKVARQVFQKIGSPQVTLLWLIALTDATDETIRKQELEKEITDAVEKSTAPADLEDLIRRRNDRFPAAQATFRLAELATGSNDLAAQRKWLSKYVDRFPTGPRAQEARDRLGSFERMDEARPATLGLLIPLSGADKTYGEQILWGASLAMNIYAAPGSAPSDGIKLVIQDSGETPEQAVEGVKKLIEKDQVMAILGPITSKQSQAAAKVAAELGVPIISMSVAEGIPAIGPTVFRSGLTKSEQAARLAQLAIEVLGHKRAAILYPENNYGSEFMTFFWKEFTARGGEIRGAESYDPQATDYGSPLKRLTGLNAPEMRRNEICSAEEASRRAEGPACYPADKLPPAIDFEVLFVPDSYERAMQVAPSLPFYDIRGVQILGTNFWNTPDLFRGGNTSYLQGSVFLDGFVKRRSSPEVVSFMERFYTVFGREPGMFEAEGFDTVSLARFVISKSNPSDRGDFVRALSSVKDFPGVSGKLTVRPDREIVRSLVALTVDGDKIVDLQ